MRWAQRDSLGGTYEAAQERAAAHTIMQLAQRHLAGAKRYTRRQSRVTPSSTLADMSAGAAQAREASDRLESEFESYQFVGEDSRVHLDMRFRASKSHHRQIDAVSAAMVLMIGVSLAIIAVVCVGAVSVLHSGRVYLVEAVMWSGCASSDACAREAPRPQQVWLAGVTFVLLGVVFVLTAVGFTLWEPSAFGSGLPRLKAFLNGCHVDILRTRTLVAKIVGIVFIVASGLPLGREGPMVHVGAPARLLAHPAALPSLRLPYFPSQIFKCGHAHDVWQGRSLPHASLA